MLADFRFVGHEGVFPPRIPFRIWHCMTPPRKTGQIAMNLLHPALNNFLGLCWLAVGGRQLLTRFPNPTAGIEQPLHTRPHLHPTTETLLWKTHAAAAHAHASSTLRGTTSAASAVTVSVCAYLNRLTVSPVRRNRKTSRLDLRLN